MLCGQVSSSHTKRPNLRENYPDHRFLTRSPNSIRAYEGDSPVLSEGKGVGKRLTELYIPNPSPNQMALESAFFWSPFEYTGFL